MRYGHEPSGKWAPQPADKPLREGAVEAYIVQPKEITARKGPNGCVAIVLKDDQGRVVSHLLRPAEAGNLARELQSIAAQQSAIEKVAAVS